MNYISEFESRLNDLDMVLASFYEIDLLPADKSSIDAMGVLYYFIRKRFNDSLKGLAK